MSVLSDGEIRHAIQQGWIRMDPFDGNLIQPASIDIKMGSSLRVFHKAGHSHIDVRKPTDDLMDLVELEDDQPYMLHPGEFVLGRSLERVELGPALVARLEGKSSLGRLGLIIHSTAGFIDPGFCGTVTLELSNNANLPITLYPNMLIGQLSFMELGRAAEQPYGSDGMHSKYQGQEEPTSSRMHLNFEEDNDEHD